MHALWDTHKKIAAGKSKFLFLLLLPEIDFHASKQGGIEQCRNPLEDARTARVLEDATPATVPADSHCRRARYVLPATLTEVDNVRIAGVWAGLMPLESLFHSVLGQIHSPLFVPPRTHTSQVVRTVTPRPSKGINPWRNMG